MSDADRLRQTLLRIDGRGYRAYREIRGHHALPALALFVDHVQSDPFAAPSLIRLRVPMARAALPPDLLTTPVRRVALADWLARQVDAAIQSRARGRRGSGKSGQITIDVGGQEVLERSALRLTDDWVEARIEIGLPADGRRVRGHEAVAMLLDDLPQIAATGLHWAALDGTAGRVFVQTVENYHAIRDQLAAADLVAFVADGARLPRQSGASELPLQQGVLPFHSPPSLRVEMALPHPTGVGGRRVSGLGIPAGVTLIVGGGYHGKSTLLQAIQRGVYPHIPGDGREQVVTRSDGVKIRAEDGRRVARVDISPFISDLPFGRTTHDFSTEDASGSTSQAASIMEALEVGARLLLLDEDTSATNFMVRDARMQALVERAAEPITPFLERVRPLHRDHAVSTILVMGGSGDYFDVADTVLMMRDYRPTDATGRARAVAAALPTARRDEPRGALHLGRPRAPLPATIDASRGRRPVRIAVRGRHDLLFGRTPLDLHAVEQLVDPSQSRAAALALHLAADALFDGRLALSDALDILERRLATGGLQILDPRGPRDAHPGALARPRRFEIAAALNRLRTLEIAAGTE